MTVPGLIRVENPPCRDDPELFYSEARDAVIVAKRLCASCPVRVRCADNGADEEFGVWGGLSAADRRAARRRAADSPPTARAAA